MSIKFLSNQHLFMDKLINSNLIFHTIEYIKFIYQRRFIKYLSIFCLKKFGYAYMTIDPVISGFSQNEEKIHLKFVITKPSLLVKDTYIYYFEALFMLTV